MSNGGICVVAQAAYGAMTGGLMGHMGGVELQTSMMCRWLAARGYRVSLVTWDEGQPDDVEVDGVRIIKLCRQDAGVPGIRFIYPRWTSLIRAMRRADAELYYQNCAEYVTGQVALWARRHGRPFIYSVASDPDCDTILPNMRSLREKLLYKYGLRHADRIIVQTQQQQEMLRSGFGLESLHFPMPCIGPSDASYAPPNAPKNGSYSVLWVGRISKVKRLELLIEIAESLPDVDFDVAGQPNINDSYAKRVMSRAAVIPNITLHGLVPRDSMPSLYRKASLLCCTSAYEGFPNTFIEAWSYGVPVVATVDPDGLIMTRKLGAIADNCKGIVSNICSLLANQELWLQASSNARYYFMENHFSERAMPRFEKIFTDVMRGK